MFFVVMLYSTLLLRPVGSHATHSYIVLKYALQKHILVLNETSRVYGGCNRLGSHNDTRYAGARNLSSSNT